MRAALARPAPAPSLTGPGRSKALGAPGAGPVTCLRREGFAVEQLHDGPGGLAAALAGSHDAIILDVMLPGLGGIEVLRAIRERKHTPIVMLTARGDHVDRVVGLEMGADDYVPKPFDPRELVARIRAVLRRSETSPRVEAGAERLTFGSIVADPGSRQAWNATKPLQLTAAEFDLLVLLIRSAGRFLTRDQISRAVLGRPLAPQDRSSVDTHISNLRRKLGPDGDGASIKTVRSAGYMLVRNPTLIP